MREAAVEPLVTLSAMRRTAEAAGDPQKRSQYRVHDPNRKSRGVRFVETNIEATLVCRLGNCRSTIELHPRRA
jgi:hypothetical protein